MPLNARGWIAAVALALMVAAAAAQSGGRAVHLELFPGKDSKPVPVVVRENETLITTIKELGTLAFEVRFRDKETKMVLVVVFDAETSPQALLGATEVPVDGKRIERTRRRHSAFESAGLTHRAKGCTGSSGPACRDRPRGTMRTHGRSDCTSSPPRGSSTARQAETLLIKR